MGLGEVHTEHSDDWLRDVPCIGQGDLFDKHPMAPPPQEAVDLCKSCDFTERCLDWVLESSEQVGFAAGMTEKDRRREQRRREARDLARQRDQEQRSA